MPETLGEFLRRYRKRAGLSQKDAAATIEVDRRTVERWESDIVSPPANRLKALLKLYKAPASEWANALEGAA